MDKYLIKAVEMADSEIELLKEKKIYHYSYFWIYNEDFKATYKKIGKFQKELVESDSKKIDAK